MYKERDSSLRVRKIMAIILTKSPQLSLLLNFNHIPRLRVLDNNYRHHFKYFRNSSNNSNQHSAQPQPFSSGHHYLRTLNSCTSLQNYQNQNILINSTLRVQHSKLKSNPSERKMSSLATAEEMKSGRRSSKFELADKYQGLESNVWVEFIDLNAKLNPVNLGQGFPDFMPAENVIKELMKVCTNLDAPLLHQYTRGYGHPRLVKALANLYGRLINRTINPTTEVLISGGAYGSLFCAIMSNVGPGDEVIIIEPFFDCYEPLVKLAGGVPKFIALRQTNPDDETSESWKLDMNELASLFSNKTKMIILNSPNNPLGKVFSRQELTEIGELCKEFDVIVVSDEVYEWLVYEGKEHVRIASLEGMWERTVTIGSAGKTFSLTGWKTGWAYGPAHLMKNLQVAHQNCVYTCNTPLQEALGAALEVEIKRLGTPNSFFYKMVTDLKERRDKMTRMMKRTGLTPVIPEGGYFMMANWRPMENKTDLSSETDPCADYRFVKWLAKTHKLLGIPPSAFYTQADKYIGEDYIRFCFYKKTETLQKADEILKQWKNS